MGISRYCLCSWLAAALAAPTAAAQQPPATTAPLRPVYVNLRLDPDLGEALPEIRAALLGLGSARIAEPADYEITTKRDFPQSLIAVDAQQPQSDWRNDFTTDPVRPAPRTVELGNLALGDFTARLRGLVDRRDRANRLLVRGLAGATAKVDTCLVVYPRSPEPHDCHSDSLQARAAADPVRAELDGETIFTASMLNRSARPRYTALLVVDPSAGIMRVPLNADGDKKPLAPGARVDSDLINLGYSSGYIMLVTVDSDHPIDTSALEQISLDEPEWDDCLPVEARCARPEFAIPPEWSVSVAEYHYNAPTLVGIGGGMAVTDGMAPWMAEIYSTVPFTPKEFADDLRAPEHERKHLARRSKQELDHRCGGTLIAANLVLTAAHCVASEPFAGGAYPRVLKDRRVRIGTKRLGMGGTTLAIAGVAVPTGYTPGRQEHDIALLLLRPDRDTRRFAEERVRLGEKPIAPGTGVTAFGWGYTGVVAPDANPLFNIAEQLQRNPDQLRYGQMQALAWGACKRRLKAKLGSGMVCVVAPETETGAAPDTNVFSCRGDSGGPLVRKIGGVEELVGVTSWSLGCGYKDIPSVYTDVTKYRRWIEAAKRQLKPGAALRVDEKAAPSREEGRRQAAQ